MIRDYVDKYQYYLIYNDTVTLVIKDNKKKKANKKLFFEKFIKVYGYYDFFLIDSSGEIFYSVAKEADYKTNVLTGPYNDSGLASLFKEVTKKTVIWHL